MSLLSFSDFVKRVNWSVEIIFIWISQRNPMIANTEDLEDLIDVKDAALAELNPENKERIPWEVIKQELSQP